MNAHTPERAPLFSVVCPTFNCADKVAPTLQSVLSQESVELECIMADGGSDDGTLEVVQRFAGSRLRCDSQRDTGIYDAMNRGRRLSTGRFLYFIGAGDTLYPNVLRALAAEANLAQIDHPALVYGNVYWEEQGGTYDGPFSRFKLSTRNICHQAIFYHREVFQLISDFDLRYRTHADYVFNLRCYNAAEIEKRYVPLTIARYEGRGRSGAAVDQQFARDYKALVREHLGLLPAVYRQKKLFNPVELKRAVQRRFGAS